MNTTRVKTLMLEFKDDEGKELVELINYYRILSKKTWFEFLLSAVRDYIAQENEFVASAVQVYMDKYKNTVKMGKPIGTRRTKASRLQQSKKMKEMWARKRELLAKVGEQSHE